MITIRSDRFKRRLKIHLSDINKAKVKANLFYLLCLLTYFFCSESIASEETPYDTFNFESSKAVEISIKTSTNLKYDCDSEAKKRKKPLFERNPEACSFWWIDYFQNKKCLIIIPTKVDYWILGHESRHCFQGEFHENKN